MECSMEKEYSRFSILSDFLSKLFNISKEDFKPSDVRDPSLEVGIMVTGDEVGKIEGIECKKCGCFKATRELLKLHTCDSDEGISGVHKRKLSTGLNKRMSTRTNSQPPVKKSKYKSSLVGPETQLLVNCGVCSGCKSKFCGSCKTCNTGKMWLCKSKVCDKVRNRRTRRKAGTLFWKGQSKDVLLVCYICGLEPKVPSRSELYRHYATEHFSRELEEEFGHLEICPQCGLEFTHCSDATRIAHFGQKHLAVEKYLPTWMKISRRSLGRDGSSKHSDLRERYVVTQFPEIPKGFDPQGKVRAVHVGPDMSVIVDGFEIELVMDSDLPNQDNIYNNKSISDTSRTEGMVVGCEENTGLLGERRVDCHGFERGNVIVRNYTSEEGKELCPGKEEDRTRNDSMSSGYESSCSNFSTPPTCTYNGNKKLL